MGDGKEFMTVVITGGAQGIGRITAEMMKDAGYRVAVWDADMEALDEEREKWGDDPGYVGICCEVSSEEAVRNAVERTLSAFGRIDILVNNAAIHANLPLAQLDPSEWRRVLDVNLTGPLLCTKFCETELRKNKGCIVNLCSTRAFQSEANTEAYSASKGGIYALTHALAVSLGPDVRVNCVSPGWIDVSSVRKKSSAKQEILKKEDHFQHPAGRVGEAGDISRMILFLCDPANSFITGQNFTVDGGMSARMIYV